MKLDAIFTCPKCESSFIVEDRYDIGDKRFFGNRFMDEYLMNWEGGRMRENCPACKENLSMNCRVFLNGALWVNDEDEEKCGD